LIVNIIETCSSSTGQGNSPAKDRRSTIVPHNQPDRQDRQTDGRSQYMFRLGYASRKM